MYKRYDHIINLYKMALEGNMDAQYYLGMCYQSDYYRHTIYECPSVQNVYDEAMKWYKKGAEQGYADAKDKLGWFYEVGWGIPQDYDKAVEWYREAAQDGSIIGQYDLGRCYENGWGVSQDYVEAAKWYLEAAERGNINASYDLSDCCEKGLGVPDNWRKEVFKLCKKAREL